jgi:hypothetical protein
MEIRLRSLRTLRIKKKETSDSNFIENQENKTLGRCSSNGCKKLTIDMRTEKLEKIHSRVLSTKQLKQKLGIKCLKTVPFNINFSDSKFTEKLNRVEKIMKEFYLS